MRFRQIDQLRDLILAGIPVTTDVRYRQTAEVVMLAQAAAQAEVRCTFTGTRYRPFDDLMLIGRSGNGFVTLVDEGHETE